MKTLDLANKIYHEAIVIDGQLGFEPAMPWSFSEKWALVDRYAKAGFTALTLSLANEETTTEQALLYLAKIRKYIFDHPEKYILAKTKADILRAKAEGKIALRLMFQGTNAIGKNLDLLETFNTLGITSLLLAYNIRTPIGDGVVEEYDSGLSHFGKAFIAEMNRLGMLIDGSHGGYKTTMDALKETNSAMVFSHSGVYNVHPHIRNLRDEQIKATAQTGGVIGINGIGLLLGDAKASVEKYVEHIDYVRQLVGSQYVALGLDNLYFADQFNEFMQNQAVTHPTAYANAVTDATVWECLQPESIISVVEQLLIRDYSESEIFGILGGNLLRLMQ